MVLSEWNWKMLELDHKLMKDEVRFHDEIILIEKQSLWLIGLLKCINAKYQSYMRGRSWEHVVLRICRIVRSPFFIKIKRIILENKKIY